MNQIIGWQPLGGSGASTGSPARLATARRIAGERDASTLHLFAGRQASVATHSQPGGSANAYVWGGPRHATVPAALIAAWCADVATRGELSRFTELVGPFVAIIDEPGRRRLTLVSDPLGIQPLFVAATRSRIVFGSDAWTMFDAGLISGACDYDAVASWLAYGYNCTPGSVFADLRRVPAATALVMERGELREVAYAKVPVDSMRRRDRAAEDIHEVVSTTTKTLLSGRDRLTVPLSGGFDSRYLLALALRHQVPIERVVNVSFDEREGAVARRVAEVLKVPLEVVPVGTSVWDLYDEVYHVSPDGFPTSKFVTHVIGQRYPGIAMVNGFLGDSLLRGSNDTLGGRYEDELRVDLADALQEKHFAVSLNLFERSTATGIRVRSRLPMEEASRRGCGRVFAWADLYLRQRHYIANNFLQHLDLADAVLPFYSQPLIAYKLRHHHSTFGRHIYASIFNAHFPELADVPHASDLSTRPPRMRLARCIERWARALLVRLANPRWLSVLARQTCLPLLLLGASSFASLSSRAAYIVEDAVLLCQRMYLLERRLRDSHVDFEWRAIAAAGRI